MEQLFFCFGPPKSGTTFLQRLLNAHPEISCPSEQHLDYLFRGLEGLFTEYNKGIALTDRRTGAQGAFQVTSDLSRQLFRDCVARIAQTAAGNKQICGLNDNGILQNIQLYKQLFPEARFIAIFRHPIPRAISAWQHNTRLAREENSSRHRELIESAGGYEGWIVQLAKDFHLSVETYRSLLDGDPRSLHVTYEQLLRSDQELRRVIKFTGATCDDKTVGRIRAENAIDRLRASSSHPHFFRAASTDIRDPSISPELLREVDAITGPSLEFLGYPRELVAAELCD